MTSVDPLVAHLVEARKKAGLSQAKVAGAVGFSCATSGRLSEYETGRRQPSLATLRRWAQVLGFEPAWVELAYEPKIFYSHEEFDAFLASIPLTAPAVPEMAAGNGATPQDGRELSSVAPASDPAPLNSVAGSDVALPCNCLDDNGGPCCCLEDPALARTLDDCPCGHSWGRHIFGQLPDSELCCVADCDKTRCPGAAVSLISTPGKPAVEGYSNLYDVPPTLNPNAIRDAYGLGPDPSVALIAFNDALAEDPDFAAAWQRALEREPVARTLDVAERTVEKARADRVKIVADAIRKEASKYPGDGNESPCIQDEDECMRAHVHLGWLSNGVIGAVYAHPDSLAQLAVEALALDAALPVPAPVERGPAHDPPPGLS